MWLSQITLAIMAHRAGSICCVGVPSLEGLLPMFEPSQCDAVMTGAYTVSSCEFPIELTLEWFLTKNVLRENISWQSNQYEQWVFDMPAGIIFIIFASETPLAYEQTLQHWTLNTWYNHLEFDASYITVLRCYPCFTPRFASAVPFKIPQACCMKDFRWLVETERIATIVTHAAWIAHQRMICNR